MITRLAVAIAGGLMVAAASGCGAKGPPLPPLRPIPAAPAALAISRVGDRVTVRLRVPEANTDPATPLSISAVAIYARTVPMGSEAPTPLQLVRPENLIATIPVRPAVVAPADAAPDAPATAATDTRPGPGEPAVWTDVIRVTEPRAFELTRDQKARALARRPLWLPLAPSGLVARWFTLPLPTRYYTAVGVSARRQPGPASPIAALTFGPSPAPPADAKLVYSETELTLTWTTSPPGMPVTVVETTRDGAEKPTPAPMPPVTTGSWSTSFEFGIERCFVVRSVLRRGAVSTESAPTAPACQTPKDTFGPPAPTGLVPVSSPDAVTLVWEGVTASDLAGYLVLRGTPGSETLQQLTPAPIALLQYSDTTARAGQRYIYYVVAVDALGNRGPRSVGVTVDRFTLAGK